MRKILGVVVIAGAACLEPIPQTPVSEEIVEPSRPPTGRIKVVEAHGPPQFPDLERTFGPVIASGTAAGRSWSLRGRIDTLGAAMWLQNGNGGGGDGGRGALPFQDLGWKKLGHFGTVASGERGIGSRRMLSLAGVVSKQTAAIEVRLADGTSLPAQIIDTGDARANFFVAVWAMPSPWKTLIARDAGGAELETYREH